LIFPALEPRRRGLARALPDRAFLGFDRNEKHLDLIQRVIERMALNSFLLKGWSFTLVAALLALAGKDADLWLVAIALLPALTFWGHGYFLAQERLFRKLYEGVIGSQGVPPYSLKTAACSSSLWLKAVFSPTLSAFHGVVSGFVVAVSIFL